MPTVNSGGLFLGVRPSPRASSEITPASPPAAARVHFALPRQAEPFDGPAHTTADGACHVVHPRARARARRHGHRLPRPGPAARPAGRAEGASPRSRPRARPRALPARDPARRPAAAPAHPHRPRLGRGRRPALVHHAVRRGRVAPRPAPAGAAAAGGRGAPDRHRGGAGARVRAPARRDPPGHQAREPAAHRGRLHARRRFRHRAGPERGRTIA